MRTGLTVRVGTSTRFAGGAGTLWTVGSRGEGWDPSLLEQIRELNSTSDRVVFTYWPARPDGDRWVLDRPEAVHEHFARMLEFGGMVRARRLAAGDGKGSEGAVVVQEVGYPSGAKLTVATGAALWERNSEANQAVFVRNLFDAFEETVQGEDRIDALLWWGLFDHGDPASRSRQDRCTQLASIWNAPDDFWLKEVYCTMGMKHASGGTKAAWESFGEGSSRLAGAAAAQEAWSSREPNRP